MFRARCARSGWPCGRRPRWLIFAPVNSAAAAFGHAATQAPHPMHAAASIARSAFCFGTGMRVAVLRAAGRDRNISAAGDNAVERAAVDDQIFDDRKRSCAPGLEVEHVAVFEVAHMELANRGCRLRTVRDSVDHESARAANAFAAIVIESDRLFALRNEIFVEHVEHFQKRHVRIHCRVLRTGPCCPTWFALFCRQICRVSFIYL